jgi:hypothetical protein
LTGLYWLLPPGSTHQLQFLPSSGGERAGKYNSLLIFEERRNTRRLMEKKCLLRGAEKIFHTRAKFFLRKEK